MRVTGPVLPETKDEVRHGVVEVPVGTVDTRCLTSLGEETGSDGPSDLLHTLPGTQSPFSSSGL